MFSVAPDKSLVTGLINSISFVAPPSPLISQGPDIPQEVYCPLGSNGLPECPASNRTTDGYCECVHVIRVRLGAVVQLVMADVSE